MSLNNVALKKMKNEVMNAAQLAALHGLTGDTAEVTVIREESTPK